MTFSTRRSGWERGKTSTTSRLHQQLLLLASATLLDLLTQIGPIFRKLTVRKIKEARDDVDDKNFPYEFPIKRAFSVHPLKCLQKRAKKYVNIYFLQKIGLFENNYYVN